MAVTYRINLETGPNLLETAIGIRKGLSSYNRQHAAEDTFTPITLIVRDEQGAVCGGLLGGTYWDWLVVETLWLADEARGQGLGSQMLERAEQIARERGCHAAHLDTMDFQAPEFYQQHGYRVFGVLEDLPPGHRRIFMQKELVP